MRRFQVYWAILLLPVWVLAQDYPSWWIGRGVISTNVALTNDFAGVNAGQLKWVATNAYNEIRNALPNGAGSNLTATISAFTPSNNYVGINLGQLKNLAGPFYDRLIQESYTSDYPWTTNTIADDVDYSLANVGQVKNVFSFDLRKDDDVDGMADWWEARYGVIDPVADPDGDGLSNLAEYQNLLDPTNSDTDGDGLPDGWELQYGFDPHDSNTASIDADGDGLSNLEEHRIGSNPLLYSHPDTNHWAGFTLFTPLE